MRKIGLAPAQLRVESFATTAAPDPRTAMGGRGTTPRCGTVRAGESCYAGCTAEVCEPTWEC